jgi:hypothetical protein
LHLPKISNRKIDAEDSPGGSDILQGITLALLIHRSASDALRMGAAFL